jgi:hypothetical protein
MLLISVLGKAGGGGGVEGAWPHGTGDWSDAFLEGEKEIVLSKIVNIAKRPTCINKTYGVSRFL